MTTEDSLVCKWVMQTRNKWLELERITAGARPTEGNFFSETIAAMQEYKSTVSVSSKEERNADFSVRSFYSYSKSVEANDSRLKKNHGTLFQFSPCLRPGHAHLWLL